VKVVLDANVLISSLLTRRGQGARIVQAWRDGLFELRITDGIVDEVAAVLRRPKLVSRYRLQDENVVAFLEELRLATTAESEPELPLPEVRDASDVHVVNAGVTLNADLVVTNDDDLLSLGEFSGIPFVRLADFLRTLGMQP
jgi:putative PIN family toxin of toxin-antitoxin system